MLHRAKYSCYLMVPTQEVTEVLQVRQSIDLSSVRAERASAISQGKPQCTDLYPAQLPLTTGSQACNECRTVAELVLRARAPAIENYNTTFLHHREITRKWYRKLAACNKTITVQRSQENLISMHEFECWTKRDHLNTGNHVFFYWFIWNRICIFCVRQEWKFSSSWPKYAFQIETRDIRWKSDNLLGKLEDPPDLW